MRFRARICLLGLIVFLSVCTLHIIRNRHTHSAEPVQQSNSKVSLTDPTRVQCTYSTCFNSSQCAYEHPGQPLNRITVYVDPSTTRQNDNPHTVSAEHVQLLTAIRQSRYAVRDPLKACLFVPNVDLLNNFGDRAAPSLRGLTSQPWWNNGENRLLFTILPGQSTAFIGSAILASARHSRRTYRPTFDVAIPAFNPLFPHRVDIFNAKRIHILTVLPINDKSNQEDTNFTALLLAYRKPEFHGNTSILLLKSAERGNSFDHRDALLSRKPYEPSVPIRVHYAKVLQQSQFCLIPDVFPVNQLALFDVLASGCIPVIADDHFVLPFSEVLDWLKIAIRIRHSEMDQLVVLLTSYGPEAIGRFQRQIHFVFEHYFASMDRIALTTLEIINDRVFPYYARSYLQWNSPDHKERLFPTSPLLFYPPRSPTSVGFTALIRGHHHFSLLHRLLTELQWAPALRRILVVWTNTAMPFPAAALWPALRVPLSVLPVHPPFGRYYPNNNKLTTEAIFSLEDYVCPPSLRAIQTAYELWTQNPESLVGITPFHSVNANMSGMPIGKQSSLLSTSFRATFFHKHYLHSYTELLSATVLRLVNNTGSCQELFMNWLISQLSGKPALVVHDSATSDVSFGCQPKPQPTCLTQFDETQRKQVQSILLGGEHFQISPWRVSSHGDQQ